jgi:HlyD family secretion protein
MRIKLTAFALAAVLVATGGAWFHFHASTVPPRLAMVPATRGDIVQVVNCTATLAAQTTVNVGSQVSGTIASLGADFNSVVRKGQVLARIDPAEVETQVAAARANLVKAAADADVARAAVDDASEKDARTRTLAAQELVPASDLDDADVALKLAKAQLREAEAAVAAAKGTVEQREVDLAHTVITSPIDGIVVSRKVDVGQTVAAGFEAPSLFEVAADLRKMRLQAPVDESDIGYVRPGQPVRFHVDAFPNEEFGGTVSQVRLQPTVDLMVVSYTTMIDVDNSSLRLKPGMTATVQIEVARHDGVIRVPTQALRFRPTVEVLNAIGERAEAALSTRVPATIATGQRVQIWVGGPGHIEPRTVRTGLSDGPFTEIADGLSKGTMVAVAASLQASNSPMPVVH